jgi:hypothetical protein
MSSIAGSSVIYVRPTHLYYQFKSYVEWQPLRDLPPDGFLLLFNDFPSYWRELSCETGKDVCHLEGVGSGGKE